VEGVFIWVDLVNCCGFLSINYKSLLLLYAGCMNRPAALDLLTPAKTEARGTPSCAQENLEHVSLPPLLPPTATHQLSSQIVLPRPHATNLHHALPPAHPPGGPIPTPSGCLSHVDLEPPVQLHSFQDRAMPCSDPLLHQPSYTSVEPPQKKPAWPAPLLPPPTQLGSGQVACNDQDMERLGRQVGQHATSCPGSNSSRQGRLLSPLTALSPRPSITPQGPDAWTALSPRPSTWFHGPCAAASPLRDLPAGRSVARRMHVTAAPPNLVATELGEGSLAREARPSDGPQAACPEPILPPARATSQGGTAPAQSAIPGQDLQFFVISSACPPNMQPFQPSSGASPTHSWQHPSAPMSSQRPQSRPLGLPTHQHPAGTSQPPAPPLPGQRSMDGSLAQPPHASPLSVGFLAPGIRALQHVPGANAGLRPARLVYTSPLVGSAVRHGSRAATKLSASQQGALTLGRAALAAPPKGTVTAGAINLSKLASVAETNKQQQCTGLSRGVWHHPTRKAPQLSRLERSQAASKVG
jgi:hypothetical protein